MAWLVVNYYNIEQIVSDKPVRCQRYLGNWVHRIDINKVVSLPKGTIKRLIGRELTWDDEPVEFNEVVE